MLKSENNTVTVFWTSQSDFFVYKERVVIKKIEVGDPQSAPEGVFVHLQNHGRRED